MHCARDFSKYAGASRAVRLQAVHRQSSVAGTKSVGACEDGPAVDTGERVGEPGVVDVGHRCV